MDSEDVWRVNPGEEPEVESLGPILSAPHVGRAQPEELSLAVGEAGQPGLHTMSGLPGL